MGDYIGLLLILLVGIVLSIYVRKLGELRNENLQLEENIQLARFFFDEVQEHADGIRRYRHDLKKHIQIVETFLEEGKQFGEYQEYQELNEQIRRMQEDMQFHQSNQYSDSEVLNAICMIKERECRDKGIAVKIDISCGDPDWVDDFHLTGILMNLLDNAIEAQSKVEPETDRLIYLSVKEHPAEGTLVLMVGNRVMPGTTPDFKTSKEDKDNHGLGLKIAEEYVRIYHGSLACQMMERSSFMIFKTTLYQENR